MRKKTLICSVCTFLIVVACRDVIEKSNASLADSIEHSVRQYSLQTKAIDKSSEGLIPYSIDSLGEVTYTSYQDWRSGFSLVVFGIYMH